MAYGYRSRRSKRPKRVKRTKRSYTKKRRKKRASPAAKGHRIATWMAGTTGPARGTSTWIPASGRLPHRVSATHVYDEPNLNMNDNVTGYGGFVFNVAGMFDPFGAEYNLLGERDHQPNFRDVLAAYYQTYTVTHTTGWVEGYNRTGYGGFITAVLVQDAAAWITPTTWSDWLTKSAQYPRKFKRIQTWSAAASGGRPRFYMKLPPYYLSKQGLKDQLALTEVGRSANPSVAYISGGSQPMWYIMYYQEDPTPIDVDVVMTLHVKYRAIWSNPESYAGLS